MAIRSDGECKRAPCRGGLPPRRAPPEHIIRTSSGRAGRRLFSRDRSGSASRVFYLDIRLAECAHDTMFEELRLSEGVRRSVVGESVEQQLDVTVAVEVDGRGLLVLIPRP